MALAIAVVILTSVTIVTINSLRNSRQSATQSSATAFAKDGLEIARGMHTDDYEAFRTLVEDSYCLAKSCTSISAAVGACGKKIGENCDINIDETYVRELQINFDDLTCTPSNSIAAATYTRVSSTVSYRDSQCAQADNPYCHKTTLSSCLVSNSSRSSP